jgi:hypothetical protein
MTYWVAETLDPPDYLRSIHRAAPA